MLVLGHSLVSSLVCSQRSLICLPRPSRSAHALCHADSFACSLTHSLACGKMNDWTAIFSVFFFLFWTIVHLWTSSFLSHKRNQDRKGHLELAPEDQGQGTMGKKPGHFEAYNHTLSCKLGSEWVNERAKKWAQQSTWAKQAVWSKQMSKRCEQTSKRTSEWPSTYIWIVGFSGP